MGKRRKRRKGGRASGGRPAGAAVRPRGRAARAGGRSGPRAAGSWRGLAGSLGAGGRREVWLALAALAALLCVAYANVIFDGRSLVYSNGSNPLDERFLEQNYGPRFEPADTWWGSRNLLNMVNYHDPGGPLWQWEPDAEFVRKALRAGELPWWNPYVGMGTPEMANMTSTAAFPPYLAMLALGNTSELRNAYQLLVVLCGGCFTFLFLRRHGLTPLACLIGAAAFMFSGGVSQNVGSFQGQAIACIPFTLYLTRRFLDRPGARTAAVMAFGFGVAALSSFPPTLVVGFGFTALYAVTAVMLTPAEEAAGAPPRGRLLVGFALAAIAAVGLVGFYYLPAIALEHATPQVAEAYETAARYAVKPVTLLQLTSPVLMGGSEVLLHSPMGEPDAPHLSYAGLVPLLLSALALRPGPGRERTLWMASWIGMALALMKLVGVPPVQWIAYLPLFKKIHFAFYLGPLIDLLVAFLAALGVAQLCRGGVTYRRGVAAGAAGLLVIAGLRWIGARAGVLERPGAPQWISEWRLLLAITLVWIVLVLTGVRHASRRRPIQLVAAALLGLFACEAFAHTYYPRPRRFDTWRQPPDYVRALTGVAGYGRVYTSVHAFTADAGGAFGVFQLDSLMAFNAPRAHELYHTYVSRYGSIMMTGASQIPPEGVLDRAAVEFLAVAYSSPEVLAEADRRPYARLYDDGSFMRIYRRRASPHFFFSSDFQVTTGAQALARLGSMPPGRTLLLESQPPVAAAANRPGDPPVTVAAFGRNAYRLRVDAPRPGLVYAADGLLPGWSARVNGRPAPILPANYAFRAVPVPAGRSEVELSYWPPGLSLGLCATGASVLALAGILAWPAARKRLARAAPATADAVDAGEDALPPGAAHGRQGAPAARSATDPGRRPGRIAQPAGDIAPGGGA